ncbi:hypothetical protein MVEN_01316500 [Mycena venus]|uniref:Uncharacterized protein n=1 Tax=Mycena venus TaxID=2733690 RepID=A0A8H7CW29_9AGAR|nr:hypothetical protein MVEN_01316500 [Mycena venus]
MPFTACPAYETRAEADSYIGKMRRVHRIEGWAGLYKGIMPSIIATLIAMVAISPFAIFLSMGHRVLPGGRVVITTPSGLVLWILSFAFAVIPAILVIPMQIITNRAITTPHKLATFAPKAALQLLLSPRRARAPMEALLRPGRRPLRVPPGPRRPHARPRPAPRPRPLRLAPPPRPPRVMGARLTLQRLGAASDGAPEADPASAPPAYGEEEVMEFRTQEAPYTGLIDCGRQMVEEEGWRALLRAWWVTPFLMLTSGVLALAPAS